MVNPAAATTGRSGAVKTGQTLSMTGFAAGRGTAAGSSGDWDWSWDLRAVNGRGLDLRFRVPDWIEGLETGLRAAVQAAVARGSVTCSLRLTRQAATAQGGLARAVAAIAEAQAAAQAAGLEVQAITAADLVNLRPATAESPDEADPAALCAALLEDFAAVLVGFQAMRAAEGAALAGIIAGQLDEIARLTAAAAAAAEDRRDQFADTLRDAVARILGATDQVDPARLAQELALIAVKSDVTEEIDRLRAHVGAARALLATPGPIGRKFDFLTQEFNREANTLCSKAGSGALTRIGLDLKTVIDQMREQVQNVE